MRASGAWGARRAARLALLVALSAAGSYVKIPSLTGTPALDSAPGYFAALGFGGADGGLVAGIGHLLTALTAGFPLGLPIHLFIALGMAGCAAAAAGLLRLAGAWAACAGAVLLNGFAFPALFILIPGFGPAFFAAMGSPLFVASAVNVGLAALAWLGATRARLLPRRGPAPFLERRGGPAGAGGGEDLSAGGAGPDGPSGPGGTGAGGTAP
ncbi:MAG: hypothetical protein K6T75_06380 [Acetobacteraceae bacterium]|nr:hypothetical protein [Acetobacteraceae bacterium]